MGRKIFLKLFKKKLSIGLIFLNIISFFSLVFLIFNLNWGLNYYRLPLSKKINLDIEYNKTELINTFNYLIQSTNLLHIKLTKDRNKIVEQFAYYLYVKLYFKIYLLKISLRLNVQLTPQKIQLVHIQELLMPVIPNKDEYQNL